MSPFAVGADASETVTGALVAVVVAMSPAAVGAASPGTATGLVVTVGSTTAIGAGDDVADVLGGAGAVVVAPTGVGAGVAAIPPGDAVTLAVAGAGVRSVPVSPSHTS